MLFLVEPTCQYMESFLEGLREFQQEGVLLQYDIPTIRQNCAHFVQQIQREKHRQGVAPGYVPATRYWLIEGTEQEGVYIGNITVRHELNDFLLKVAGHIGYQIRPSMRRRGYGTQGLHLGLHKAKEIGIYRALLTCDETNLGSKKVIEYNGGQFENAVSVEGSPVKKLRYWIDIA